MADQKSHSPSPKTEEQPLLLLEWTLFSIAGLFSFIAMLFLLFDAFRSLIERV